MCPGTPPGGAGSRGGHQEKRRGKRASRNWQPGKGIRWSTQEVEVSAGLYKRIMTLGTPPENHGSACLFPDG